MAEEAAQVTTKHVEYVAAHTLGDDEFLKCLKAAAKAASIPEIAISAAQASFLQIMLKLHKAVDVVEVGTLAGYSAIAMARALPAGGKVRTVELDPTHAAFARDWVAKSDVAEKVEVLQGAGKEILPTMATNSADAAFLDADKAGYKFYLDQCMRIVRQGGLIMADNAFAFGQLFDSAPTDPGVPYVREFNDYIAQKPGLHPIIVPIGDGCWVAVKT